VYAELAAEVAVPVEVHEKRAAGTAVEEQQAIAETHLARFSLRSRHGQKDVFVLDDPTRSRLASEFAGVVALIDGAELTIDDVLQFPDMERRTLHAFVTSALKRDARRKYLQTQALLRDGLPHATINSGSVKAEVILSTGADGRIMARFANEKNVTKAADAISELTFDFTLGAFPPIS
jgi:hypothetical protein